MTQRRAPGWSFDIYPARSSSVRFENSPFGQVRLSGLEQFETFNPRTRSQDGNDRMGERFVEALLGFTVNPAASRKDFELPLRPASRDKDPRTRTPSKQ